MSGYCSLQATSVPSGSTARCTWPRLAAAAASWLKVANWRSQSGPSSLAMRRRTKLQPIAGAFGLQLRQLLGVFRRQRVGHGGQELRHLHQRALQPAQDRAQVFRMRGAIGLDAEHARAGDPRGDAAHRARGARHPPQLAEQRAGFVPLGHQPVASSSSMKPAITSRPLLPERRVRRVQPERRQQLLVPLRAAGAQHVEILRLEPRMAADWNTAYSAFTRQSPNA